MIGLLTNTVVLRTDTSGDPAFRDLLARVRAFDVAALDHQDLPFDRLVEELNPPRHPARHPLFQVMLALQNNERAVLRLGEDRVALRPTATGTAKFDLFVDVLERYGAGHAPDGLDLHVEYATDLYEPHTAEEFAQDLRALLEAVCADPGVRIGALPASRTARARTRTPVGPSARRSWSAPRSRCRACATRSCCPGPAGSRPRRTWWPTGRAAVEQVEQAFGGSARGTPGQRRQRPAAHIRRPSGRRGAAGPADGRPAGRGGVAAACRGRPRCPRGGRAAGGRTGRWSAGARAPRARRPWRRRGPGDAAGGCGATRSRRSARVPRCPSRRCRTGRPRSPAPRGAPRARSCTCAPQSLLVLSRALAERPGRARPVDLLFVTAGAQAVAGDERPNPFHAAAGALLKSLREEMPWLRGVHLDLAPGDDREAAEAILARARPSRGHGGRPA
ncbi:hypothetical protein STENM223S_10750 [Streptomyces tendae]